MSLAVVDLLMEIAGFLVLILFRQETPKIKPKSQLNQSLNCNVTLVPSYPAPLHTDMLYPLHRVNIAVPWCASVSPFIINFPSNIFPLTSLHPHTLDATGPHLYKLFRPEEQFGAPSVQP